jgi:RNA recognition motif-containing protein
MNIYISNLDAAVKNEDLRKLFSAYGLLHSAEIATDAFTDQPRGFGYVEMPVAEQAQKAITSLHQSNFFGRTIGVEEAPPKPEHKGSYKVGNGGLPGYRFKKK